MKKYLIQSDRYTGSVEVLYNNGLIIMLDFSKTNMVKPAMLEAFKKQVAVEEQYLPNSFVTDVKILPADVEISFTMFWQKYNHKINKLRATKLWDSLSLAEQVEAYLGIQKYFAYLRKNDWRGLADPDTYLRNKYWINEYK